MRADTAIVIRPLRLTDKEDWKHVWRNYLRFYSSIREDALYDFTFQRLADPAHSSMFGYVAEQQGQLQGLVNCIIHEHGWHQQPVIYLQDLFVDEKARGQGIGRRLIEQVYRYADDTGKASVYWLTQSNNHSAMKLYDSLAIKTDFIKYQR